MSQPLLIAKSERPIYLLPGMTNRHGLITGASGTGKTVTLQVMAEHFSHSGIPVFIADVKGDLAGLSQAGTAVPSVERRLADLNVQHFSFGGSPVTFWDVFGAKGHPLCATVSELGPLHLCRLLSLPSTQRAALNAVFQIADDQGLLLLDIKDLRALLEYVGDNGSKFQSHYGRITRATTGSIQRSLLLLNEMGGETFFGEPALDLFDFMQLDAHGRGRINLLAADQLIRAPQMYATVLLWLLAVLFETLPKVGDQPQPKLVFFFDEAHLLFTDTPKSTVTKISQMVRLIRSKGVGVYFVSQSPTYLPEEILGQLGNRVQHALRAFTPHDQRAVHVAAQTFRQNPALDIESAITQLAVDEALISFLDEQGMPGVTERAWILPPHSRIGPISTHDRYDQISQSPLAGKYEQTLDRESAFEILQGRAEQTAAQAEAVTPTPPPAKQTKRSSKKASAPPRQKESALGDIADYAGKRRSRALDHHVRGIFGSFLSGGK